MAETEDAGRVAIRELDLNRVVPHRRRSLRSDPWLVHWKHGRDLGGPTRLCFLLTFVVAHGTGAGVAQIRKIVMARVGIGPGDIDTCPGGNVNFQASWLFSDVEWNRHGNSMAP